MPNKLNILVTGAGGDIAQSIAKILRGTNFYGQLIGTDVHNEHAGNFFFDKIIALPLCNQSTYLEKLTEIIQKEKIDIIIPMSEPEILFFYIHNLTDSILDAKILMANSRAIEVGMDKLKTIEFLKANNLPYPQTDVVSNVKKPVFPAIMKARRGSGSKSIFKIYQQDEFDFYSKKYPDYIYQQMLLADNDEYTCGVFRSKSMGNKNIIIKRTLKGGLTGYGKVIKNDIIEQLLNSIATLLDLVGSINIQLRIVNEIPYIFEINPRFSSTVRFRHLLGFQDLLWSLEDKMGIASIDNYQNIEYAIIHKVYEELIER
jgi:carbamoyl-phosphate synthase large subunit